MDRRNFLKTGIALFTAPAIVKAENIMDIFIPSKEVIVPDFGLMPEKAEGSLFIWDNDKGDWELLGPINSSFNVMANENQRQMVESYFTNR